MRYFIFIIFSFFQFNSIASTCTEVFDSKIVQIANCRSIYDHNICPELQNEYESLKTLAKARHLLNLPSIITSSNNSDERGEGIIRLLQGQHESIQHSLLQFMDDAGHMYLTRYGAASYSKRFYKDVIHFIDSNYQDYFLRYVRILNREIPWEELQKLEKGLSLGEIMASLDDLNSNKCDQLLKRYKLRIIWKDVAREVLDNHFKNILDKNKYR